MFLSAFSFIPIPFSNCIFPVHTNDSTRASHENPVLQIMMLRLFSDSDDNVSESHSEEAGQMGICCKCDKNQEWEAD